MKKTLSLILALALCLALLSGCGKKQEPAANMENPVKVYASAGEQAQAVGFALEAPAGASEIHYQAINGMAETLFTLNGVKYFYRAEPTAELASYDMSGLNYTMDEAGKGEVAGREAAAFICSEAGYVRWLDVAPGVNYNLGTVSKTSADVLFEVACLAFSSVQGENEGGSGFAGLANPVKDYASAQEQCEATGLALEAPAGAENVLYQSINGMAQTQFTVNGVKYCYRAEPTAELESYDMSGMYYSWTSTAEGEVSYCSAVAKLCDEAAFVQWLDIVPGINYNLSVTGKVSAETLLEMAASVFVPTQGNAG